MSAGALDEAAFVLYPPLIVLRGVIEHRDSLLAALKGVVRTYRHDWTEADPPELVAARLAIAQVEEALRRARPDEETVELDQ